jgi:2-polyprenyl-3-methyl-5-hydroxy-6-metoxy-1,4-benzoquinol methylase
MVKIVRRITHAVTRVPRSITSLVRNPGSDSDRSKRDSWDARWGDKAYKPRFEIEDADSSVRKAVADGWFAPGMRVIDIGCGAGYNAAWLAEQGLETVGIDFSSRAIDRARERFSGQPRVAFEVVDAVKTGAYSETFDALVDRGCLHGIERDQRTEYARNLESWGRPGSHLLVIVRNKDRRNEQVVNRSRRVLDSGFSYLSGESVDLAGPYADEPIPAVAMRFTRAA